MSTDRQRTPQIPSTVDHVEFDMTLEDAGGLSAAGYQKQAPVRFGSSPMSQSLETLLAALGISGMQWKNTAQFALTVLFRSLSDSEAKMNNPSQLLAATVDTLVEVNEDQFSASLTDADYQRLVASLDKLSNVVGENENHPLARLMDFIGNFIKDHEEKSGMSIQTPRRERRVNRSASRPDVRRDANLDAKLSMLLKPDETIKLRREEQVGRPENSSCLEIEDLLLRETQYIADREEL